MRRQVTLLLQSQVKIKMLWQNSMAISWHQSNIQYSLTFYKISWPGENFVFPWLFSDAWQTEALMIRSHDVWTNLKGYSQFLDPLLIFTDYKGRLCFQKRLSVILSIWGGRLDRPPHADPGGGVCPTPPVGRLPLPQVVTFSGGHCSGRYASYWNAFLF